MAIDSREKRRSIAGIHLNVVPGVTPTAGKDAEWRQESGFGYPGIPAGGLAAGKISIALSAKVPTTTVSSRQPTTTISAKGPTTTITGT